MAKYCSKAVGEPFLSQLTLYHKLLEANTRTLAGWLAEKAITLESLSSSPSPSPSLLLTSICCALLFIAVTSSLVDQWWSSPGRSVLVQCWNFHCRRFCYTVWRCQSELQYPVRMWVYECVCVSLHVCVYISNLKKHAWHKTCRCDGKIFKICAEVCARDSVTLD